MDGQVTLPVWGSQLQSGSPFVPISIEAGGHWSVDRRGAVKMEA